MNSGIYCITNTLNNKVYIGGTNNFKRRELEHFSNLKHNRHSNPHLQYSYNKYGKENFEFSIVETTDKLVEKELYYMKIYNSHNQNCGYNLGTPEQNDYIKATRKSKPVYCYNIFTQDITEYKSVKVAAESLKYKHSRIQKAVIENYLIEHKYYFSYTTDFTIPDNLFKYIVVNNKGETFKFLDLKKVANYFNVPYTSIHASHKRKSKLYKPKNLLILKIENYNPKVNYVNIINKDKILTINKNQNVIIFNTKNECCNYYNMCSKTLNKHINTDIIFKGQKFYTWSIYNS